MPRGSAILGDTAKARRGTSCACLRIMVNLHLQNDIASLVNMPACARGSYMVSYTRAACHGCAMTDQSDAKDSYQEPACGPGRARARGGTPGQHDQCIPPSSLAPVRRVRNKDGRCSVSLEYTVRCCLSTLSDMSRSKGVRKVYEYRGGRETRR